MKKVMFDDMYCWSVFNDVRQIDFNGHLWVREGGNVLIDPVPMSDGDLEQFDALGGAKWIVVTNRDHEREADFFKQRTGAEVVAHVADAELLEVVVDKTVEDGGEVVAGLCAVHLPHGKSPGEIALYWSEQRLLLAGDLVVGAPVGKFSLLMDEKLQDPPKAALGLRKLLALDFDAILVGDGHSIMTGARAALLECLEERSDMYINKINIVDIPWMQGGRREGYDCEVKDIDPLIGAQNLGYQIIRLGKGQSICPLHFHHFGEEMFYVVEGSCTMVTPRGEWPVQQGDFIAFPTGPRGAHKFRNDGDEGCQLLALGEHVDHEVAEYLDSGKINVVAKRDTGQVIYRMEDSVSYWEGE
jgi:uncharacterized cupin superfamily protein/glyoxylase-like metal-dependent hydrolase (beta-lactamase superfamily II)